MKSMTAAAVLFAAVLLVGGCSGAPGPSAALKQGPASSASVTSTEALPGGGERAIATKDGLRLSADVTSTTVPVGSAITVRVELRNVGPKPIRWSDLSIGCSEIPVGIRGLAGVSIGLGSGGYGTPARPATLASGESTSVVQHLPVPKPGSYRILGGFRGTGGGSGITPDIVVRAKTAK